MVVDASQNFFTYKDTETYFDIIEDGEYGSVVCCDCDGKIPKKIWDEWF